MKNKSTLPLFAFLLLAHTLFAQTENHGFPDLPAAGGNTTCRFNPPTGTQPLSIELTGFSVRVDEKQEAQLSWSTASENQNHFFTLERTKDGVTFEIIATVEGAGSCSQRRDYSATDLQPLEGTSYYRLRQTDFAGESSTSGIITLNYERLVDFSFTPFPNPGNGGTIGLRINAGKEEEIPVSVTGMQGNLCFKTSLTVSGSENTYTLQPSENLAPGIYMVTLLSQEKVYTQKLIVQ